MKFVNPMNREILYRGKRLDNGEWVYGNYIYRENEDKTWAENIIISNDFSKTEYKVHPDTVGQYIGLKDKNGNKIFDGDIIESGLTIRHEVYFDEMEARYMVACDGDRRFLSGGINQKWIDEFQKEVIGNIHDNPELLKGGKE